MKLHLLIIDPQKDFCDPTGALYVNGADEDCIRLGNMISRLRKKWDDIHVTLDSHHTLDIAHPTCWHYKDTGNRPNPFTIISRENGVLIGNDLTTNTKNEIEFFSKQQNMVKYANHYVDQLEANGRYPLCIWPLHCLIGSDGATIVKPVIDALHEWEDNEIAMVDYVTKGSNWKTEHYSAVKADVIDPEDDGTGINTGLIEVLRKADIIAITGQALSHCVANTIRDIANDFGDENVKKFTLIEDTCSNVTNFEDLGKAFVDELTKLGMKVSNSVDFLS